MIKVIQYNEENKELWDDFIQTSTKPMFMFNRNYMDYHRDRFTDHSLMFYDDEKLVSVLPMNIMNDRLYSHGGLTFGGFFFDCSLKQHEMNDCFQALIDYSKKNNIKEIIYKSVPSIYSNEPSEEDRYALYLHHASLEKVEASTAIKFENPIKMPKGRKAQISRARREGVVIEEKTSEEDYFDFIELENSVLEKYHDTKAVHTGAELFLLHSRFPENIHLFAAMCDGEMIAGTVIFEYPSVIHTQYMAADETAREIGALDLTIKTVMDKYSSNKKYLDFGISTEQDGYFLNTGLISQKEGFGGRTIVYETYKLPIL
jgi:hypothetical protein